MWKKQPRSTIVVYNHLTSFKAKKSIDLYQEPSYSVLTCIDSLLMRTGPSNGLLKLSIVRFTKERLPFPLYFRLLSGLSQYSFHLLVRFIRSLSRRTTFKPFLSIKFISCEAAVVYLTEREWQPYCESGRSDQSIPRGEDTEERSTD